MALTHHDTAHSHERGCADSVLFCTQHSSDHNIAARTKASIGAEGYLVAQIVQRQDLVRFGKTKFPRQTRIFDGSLWARARSSHAACNQYDVCLRLRHASGNRSDPGLGNKLHANPCLRINLLQVIDQLGKIFDRVDVMVWRW